LRRFRRFRGFRRFFWFRKLWKLKTRMAIQL